MAGVCQNEENDNASETQLCLLRCSSQQLTIYKTHLPSKPPSSSALKSRREINGGSLTVCFRKETIMVKDQESGKMKIIGEELSERGGQKRPHHPQPRKKQVRRRLHTSKPYQERVLNMAEARREIVSALKLHRAAMKEAGVHHQHPEKGKEVQSPFLPPCFDGGAGIRFSKEHPSSPSALAYYSVRPPNYFYPFSFFHTLPQPNQLNPSLNPALPSAESLDFALPKRTLGLNLNFSDFDNLDYAIFNNNNLSCSSISSSTLSSSSSPNLSSATDQEVDASVSTSPDASDPIHSIGEHHQRLERGDDETNKVMLSGRWFKFLNGEENGCHPFEEAMEVPTWLISNESFLLDHLNHHSAEDSSIEDNPLPCLDLEDIEGVDGEWLK